MAGRKFLDPPTILISVWKSGVFLSSLSKVSVDQNEKLGSQPTSWILDEKRCSIENNIMTLNTEDTKEKR
jgi:hypothetical protein